MSLLPSATEIVFALGRGEDLVGVTFECDHPPEARTRRVVSTSALPPGLTPAEIDAEVSARVQAGEDLYRLDEGALADLDADLVLSQDLCAVCAVDLERVEDALDYLGCSAQVLTLDPRRLDEVIDSILMVGEVVCAEERAHELVRSSRERLRRLRDVLEGARARPTLVLEWTDPPFTAGHWVPDLVRAGGGAPLLASPGADSRRADWDVVQSTAAEVVLVAPCGYHLEESFRLADELAASDRLPRGAETWAVDADSYFVRPGPRLVDGAEIVARVLHPDRAGRVDDARARLVATAPP